MKRDLEGWREVILPINSILLWEKKSYCGFIAGTTTAVFLLLWHNDPSILTTVSFLGLAITIADYLVPTLTSHLYNADSWTSAKERKLESICRNLAANKSSFINKTKCFYHMRKDRPKLVSCIQSCFPQNDISLLMFFFCNSTTSLSSQICCFWDGLGTSSITCFSHI